MARKRAKRNALYKALKIISKMLKEQRKRRRRRRKYTAKKTGKIGLVGQSYASSTPINGKTMQELHMYANGEVKNELLKLENENKLVNTNIKKLNKKLITADKTLEDIDNKINVVGNYLTWHTASPKPAENHLTNPVITSLEGQNVVMKKKRKRSFLLQA